MSTIQPTPPSGSTAQGPATTVARITSGAQALSNTRPGGTVQVQVTSVAPGGQVTLSAPGGEITVQTANSSGGQSGSQAPSSSSPQTSGQGSASGANQTAGQTANQAANQAPGRAPAALKPGDIYTLRAGPRGSDTVSLAPQRAAGQAPAQAQTQASTDPAAPPPPRAEGSVPARLVPGAVTTATIIPRPGENFTPPPAPQSGQAPPPGQGQPQSPPLPSGASAGQPPAGQTTIQGQGAPQAPAPPPGSATSPGGPVTTSTLDTTATNLAALARSGTGALLRSALHAARAITDGATRQPPTSGPTAGTNPDAGATAASARAPAAAGLATSSSVRTPPPASPGQYAPPNPTRPIPASSTPPNTPASTSSQTAPAPPASTAGQTSTAPSVANTPSTTTLPQGVSGTGNHPGQTAAANTSRATGGQPASQAANTATTANTAGAASSAGTSGAPSVPGNAATASGIPAAANLVERFNQIQRVDLRIISVQHPGASPATAATAGANSGGAVVAGTVIGLSRSGQTILGTPRGLVTIAGQADFPPGSRVEVEILPRTARAAGGQGAGPPPAPLGHLARHWETLDQAIRLLETSNPSAANQITQNHVARPGPQLTAAIALFITAVRGGDFRAWVGESNARALEMARGGLGSTLREEFSTMQRASEPNDGGWRGFFIPFMDDGQLNQVRFFLHQEKDGDEDGDRDGSDRTRFVVDLSLSQLGDLQIDGAVQPQTVDLLIRTRDTLPEHMRREIREIFTATLARTGIEGQLAFRVQKTFPTLPIEELRGYQDSPTSDLHI